jgi:hypothetical protein
MRRPLVLVLVVAVLVLVGGALWQTWRTTPTAAAPGQDGWVSTQWGPLGPADRDLLIRVRLAGLWEHPVGQEMVGRATQARVREVGRLLSAEHLKLDVLVVEAAAKLGVLLPNQPTTEQQAWMYQITAATGAAYDWTAVNLLRQAHGSVLPTIVQVRVGTRNDLVRAFADEAAAYVQRHAGYLESTGLVDFARLDEPPTPPRAVVTRAGQYENVPVALLAVGALMLLCGLVAIVYRIWTDRRRPLRSHRHPGG